MLYCMLVLPSMYGILLKRELKIFRLQIYNSDIYSSVNVISIFKNKSLIMK